MTEVRRQSHVLIVDPSPLWRRGLETFIDDQPTLSCSASLAAFDAMGKVPPSTTLDIAVLHLGDAALRTWRQAVSIIRHVRPSIRIIGIHERLGPDDQAVLTTESDASFVDEQSPEAALVRALLDPEHRTRRRWEAPTLGPIPLTARESSILSRVAAGRTTSQIADELVLGVRTVENAKKTLFNRLGVLNQAHAVSLAIRLGLLDDPADETSMPTLLEALAVRLIQPGQKPALDDGLRISVGAVRRANAGPSVLIIRHPLSGPQILAALRNGTTAIVDETQSDIDFVAAVDRARLGRYTVPDRELQELFRTLRAPLADATHLSLTPRESDLLHSIGMGESVKQTARSLGIAVKTVENTQRLLFRKLGVRNRSQAIATAVELGLVGPVPPTSSPE